MLGVGVLAAVAGCGGAGTPQEVVAASADITEAAGTARVGMRVSYAGEGVAETFEFAGEGETDFPAGLARMTMDFGALPMAGAGSITMLVEGSTVYLQFPAVGGEAQWFRLGARDMAGALGTGSTMGTENPAQALDVLRGVTSDIEEVGSDEVRGEPTTRYDFTVDVEQALAAVPEERREGVRAAFETLGNDELPVSAWIDGDGRTRRLLYEIDLSSMSGPSDTPAGTATVTLEFFDFGVDVDLELPSQDNVIDFNQMLEEMQEFGGDVETQPAP